MADESIDQALRELRYTHVNAFNTRDLRRFTNNFTADGVWESRGGFNAAGRAAIGERVEAIYERFDSLIQVDADAAVVDSNADETRARVYFMEHGLRRDGGTHLVLGVYDEVCVLDGGVWRYARRTASSIYVGPPDLSAPLRHYPAPSI